MELRRWLTAIARRVIEAHIDNRGTVETRQYAEDPHRTPAEWRSSVAHLDALSPRQRQVWELRVREDMIDPVESSSHRISGSCQRLRSLTCVWIDGP